MWSSLWFTSFFFFFQDYLTAPLTCTDGLWQVRESLFVSLVSHIPPSLPRMFTSSTYCKESDKKQPRGTQRLLKLCIYSHHHLKQHKTYQKDAANMLGILILVYNSGQTSRDKWMSDTQYWRFSSSLSISNIDSPVLEPFDCWKSAVVVHFVFLTKEQFEIFIATTVMMIWNVEAHWRSMHHTKIVLTKDTNGRQFKARRLLFVKKHTRCD